MKNPFAKPDTSGLWIAAIAVSALAAGAITWLYFKKTEAEKAFEPVKHPFEKKKHGKKKARTDIHELHTIIPAAHDEE